VKFFKDYRYLGVPDLKPLASTESLSMTAA
jgi:hypothetical protein